MMEKFTTKAGTLKSALLSFFLGSLFQAIGLGSFGWAFWIWAVVFGLLFWRCVQRDRRLARAAPAEAVRRLPAAAPKSSPESSSFDLPDLD